MKMLKCLAALAILMGFGFSAMAQDADNENMSSTARVLAGMVVTKITDLNFGDLAQGTTKQVALNGTVTGPTQQGTETVGQLSVAATGGTSIKYTLTTPTNLTNGSNNLPITFVSEYLTASTYAAGTTTVQNVATDITMDAGGILYFYVGGTVDATGSPATGTYTGTVNLLVEYN